jgi:hypothetical protein
VPPKSEAHSPRKGPNAHGRASTDCPVVSRQVAWLACKPSVSGPWALNFHSGGPLPCRRTRKPCHMPARTPTLWGDSAHGTGISLCIVRIQALGARGEVFASSTVTATVLHPFVLRGSCVSCCHQRRQPSTSREVAHALVVRLSGFVVQLLVALFIDSRLASTGPTPSGSSLRQLLAPEVLARMRRKW